MLSKIDIERQIGKGINIVPFNPENIKENSINLTLSNMAWTICPNKSNQKNKEYNMAKSACNSTHVVLEPHSTTIVYTEEVVALNNKYGGTFHSKVGVVSKGVVFCSTMIGPSYCGHLLITLQNPTDSKIKLKIGDTFISLVLHKLDTKISTNHTNTNSGGHSEKVKKYEVKLSNDEEKTLDATWKKNVDTIIDKLHEDSAYIKFIDKRRKDSAKYGALLFLTFVLILIFIHVILSTFISNEIALRLIEVLGTLIGELIVIVSGIIRTWFKIND